MVTRAPSSDCDPPPGPWSIGSLLDWATAKLAAEEITDARRDARLLLAAALALPLSRLIGFPEQAVTRDAVGRFAALVAGRCRHAPVSRLLGAREFWSLPFGLNAHTLDPRPDTETLVAAVLARIPDPQAPLRLLDLGTGSGCILLALLSELPQAHGVGVDISTPAIAQARQNASDLGLASRAAFYVSNWADALRSDLDNGLRFDWVLSNPPYIESAALAGLAPEVTGYDPPCALDGGADGFAAYRAIAPLLRRMLTAQGQVALEHGAGQSPGLCRLLAAQGLQILARPVDLSGQPRCVVARPCG